MGTSDIWAKEFDAMVLGLIEIIDASVAKMKAHNFGRILVIGSSGIVTPIPKLAVSNTLRSAVAGYVKTLSEQVAPLGITCNMVLPGRIETPRTQAIGEPAETRPNALSCPNCHKPLPGNGITSANK